MNQGMKVLILEDAEADAELIEYELAKLKIPLNLRRVATREEFLQALEEFQPDLILADYHLHAFDGLTALALVEEREAQVSFIFVSGTMTPELTEQGLEKGAADWVNKDRLSQLPAAVERTLARLAAAPVREAPGPEDNLWSGLMHRTRKVVVVLDLDGSILEFNRGAELLTGWQRHEVLGLDFADLLAVGKKRGWLKATLAQVAAGEITPGFELPVLSRSNTAGLWFCQPTLLENLEGRGATILLLADNLSGSSMRQKARAPVICHLKPRANLIC